MDPSTTVRKGEELGVGSYGHVFRAVETNTGRVVALKQCRASLRLKRPILQHEANVLKHLSGNPSIPKLLHRSLGDTVEDSGPLDLKMVANIAHQMMDALQHIHSHQLAHHDIKPSTIMLRGPDEWKVCLIDFGLTCHIPEVPISPIIHEEQHLGVNDLGVIEVNPER